MALAVTVIVSGAVAIAIAVAENIKYIDLAWAKSEALFNIYSLLHENIAGFQCHAIQSRSK